MLKSSSLYLTIPKPCQQAWDDMTPDGTGRFCSSCDKTVTDFTSLSDEEVLAVFQKSTAKVCGRFTASQLDRNLIQQKRHQNTLLPAVMISSALVAATAANGMPSSDNMPIRPAVSAMPATTSILPPEEKDTMPLFIAGKMIATDSFPLVGAVVRICDTNYGTSTDQDGKFRLPIPDSLTSKDITFEFRYVGFKDQIINMSAVSDPQKMEVVMQSDNLTLGLTEVIFVGAIQKRTFWQRLKRLFR
ncbi:MAG TPA: carboxypeptidase-like regulatory domain-containing protein [Chitinophaga sp.]